MWNDAMPHRRGAGGRDDSSKGQRFSRDGCFRSVGAGSAAAPEGTIRALHFAAGTKIPILLRFSVLRFSVDRNSITL